MESSAVAATSLARSLSTKKAEEIAFSRTGNPMLGEFADAVVGVKAGEVPVNIFGRGVESDPSKYLIGT